MKKILIIVNPFAGKKGGMRVFEEVLPLFQKARIDVDMLETKYSGHALDIMQKIDLSSIDGVGVIGGDGTFHKLINGMFLREDKKKLPVGVIPGGSANALSLNLGASSPIVAAEKIISGNTFLIDLLEVKMPSQTRYAFGLVHCGEAVDAGVFSEKMRWLGPVRYILSALINVLFYSRHLDLEMKIEDNVFNCQLTNIMIHKAKYVGEKICIAPHASFQDGFLDCMIFQKMTKIQKIKLFRSLLNGSFSNSPFVQYFKVKSVSFVPKSREVLNMDGEFYGETPASVRVLPKVLEVFN